jgi:DNA-directed RNA polymerase
MYKPYDQLHNQFKPMIFHIIKKLDIHRNRQEFYQIGCIALWEASLRYEEDKGEFKSFAYSYIIGRMKTKLSKERKLKEKLYRLASYSNQKGMTEDDYTLIVTKSVIDDLSTNLTPHQMKWIKAFCYQGKTPSEIAEDEGVSSSAVKGWRRDTLSKLRRLNRKDLL